MRFLFYTVLAVVFVAISALTFLIVAAPVDLVRAKVIEAVKEQTGRDLAIRGDTSISIYPRLAVELGEVSLSAPPGMSSAQSFVTMDSLRVALPLMPLIQQRVEVDEFVLVRPVIRLAVDQSGRKTWHFSSAPDRRSATRPAPTGADEDNLSPELREFIRNSSAYRQEQSGGNASEPGDGSTPADPGLDLANLRLSDVRIEDGTVQYSDAATGRREIIEAINARVSLPGLDSPLAIEGEARWKGEVVPVAARFGSFRDLAEGRETSLEAALTPERVEMRFNGRARFGEAVLLEGPVRLRSASLRQLAAWFDAELPRSPGYGEMSAEGRFSFDGVEAKLADARLSLGETSGRGRFVIDTAAARPRIDAMFAIAELDVGDFTAGGSSAKQRRGDAEAGGRDANIGNLIDDLQDPATQTDGGAPSGWSSTPINFLVLRDFDLKARLQIDKLNHDDVKTGPVALALQVDNGRLNGRFDRLALYGGEGEGTFSIDARSAIPTLNADLTVRGVESAGLLKDAADFEWVAGVCDLAFAIEARGLSQRRLVATLNGSGRFDVRDGAIVGVNIPKMMRGLQQGRLTDFGRAEDQQTDFSSLTGTFRIAEGTATNDDLTLIGPLVRMRGEGTVAVPPRRVDYTVRPKLVASLEGQGGETGLAGLTVPVHIEGPWSDPDVRPDLKALLEDPESAVKAIEGVARSVRESDALKKGLEELRGSELDSQSVKKMFEGIFGGNNGG